VKKRRIFNLYIVKPWKIKQKSYHLFNKICFSKRKCELRCAVSQDNWLSKMFCTIMLSREAGFLDSVRGSRSSGLGIEFGTRLWWKLVAHRKADLPFIFWLQMRNCLLSLVLKFLGFVVVYTSFKTCLVQRGKEWGIKLNEFIIPFVVRLLLLL